MIDRSQLGVVTNCWQHQLADGQPLEDLIARAINDFGFQYFELRQGSLGAFEDSDRVPQASLLRNLAHRFPQAHFDLAVELPVFSAPFDRDDVRLKQSVDAAGFCAHLRVVDLMALHQPSLSDNWLEMVATNLGGLASDLQGGVLSVEHSCQPWSLFWPAIERVRQESGSNVRLCFDPTNLWLTDDGADAVQITDQVPVESLSMVHLKQRSGSTPLTSFASGDVDWPPLLTSLLDRSYDGPFLFEIAPSESVWSELTASVDYLEKLVAGSE
ncbi:MAG: sugar phosphate isomerase/epimerase family protein [Planctomycetota bacterium]|jgi:sugar phosphate isomerase/epimerase